jgi:bifunctional non-homologous end joining protein LigD
MGQPRNPGAGSRVPVLIRPMLATPAPLPSPAEDSQWAYEVKWDGVRAVAYLQDGQLRLMSRTDRDITRRYPELAALAGSLPDQAVVLDGELVSLDAEGRPSFGRLQHRMHAVDQAEIRRLIGRYPVTYMIFDLLHAGGQSLLGQPYVERRSRLTQLNPTGPAWQTPPSWIGGGPDLLAATAEQGLEGIIAKRIASTYQPGRRSPSWRKIKNIRTVEVLIGGWSPGGGRRTGTIGSLLVGVSTADGLAYIGNVGTGFTDAVLRELHARLQQLEIPTSPFDAVPVPDEFARFARWVRPELVGEVAYAEIGLEGRLRRPRWRGLRQS